MSTRSLLTHLADLPFSFDKLFLMTFMFLLCVLFFGMAVLASRAQARAQARYNRAMKQISVLERELVDAKMKCSSYRGKIGSLSRKLKEANA